MASVAPALPLSSAIALARPAPRVLAASAASLASASSAASTLSSHLRRHDDNIPLSKLKQKPQALARNVPCQSHGAATVCHRSNARCGTASPLNCYTTLSVALPPGYSGGVAPRPRPRPSEYDEVASSLSPLACFDPTQCSCSWLPSLSTIYADFSLIDVISPTHALLWAAFVWWCIVVGYSLTYPPMKVCNVCVAENWPPWNIWPLTLSMTLVMGFLLSVNAYSFTIHRSFKHYVRTNLQQFVSFFLIPFFVASYCAITSQRYFILFIPLNTTLVAAASASTVVVYAALRLVYAHLMKRHEEFRVQMEMEAKEKATLHKKSVEDNEEVLAEEDCQSGKKAVPHSDVMLQVSGSVAAMGETQHANTKRVHLLENQPNQRTVDAAAVGTSKNEAQEEGPAASGLSHRRLSSKPIPAPVILPTEAFSAAPPALKSVSSVGCAPCSISGSVPSVSHAATPPPSVAGSRNGVSQHKATNGELSRIAAMTEARLRFLTINLDNSVQRGAGSSHEADAERERDCEEKDKHQSLSRHSPSLRPASPNLSRAHQPAVPRAASPSLSRSAARPSKSVSHSQSRASYLRYEDDVKEFHRLHVAFSSAIAAEHPAKKLLLLRLSIHDSEEDISLVDQLLWDPDNENSTPEIYAANLCAELGFAGELGKKWIGLISEDIRKQISSHQAAFAAANLDAMCSILELPQAEAIFRSVGEAHNWQPLIQLPSKHANTPSVDQDGEAEHDEKSDTSARAASICGSAAFETDSTAQSLPMKTFREDEFH